MIRLRLAAKLSIPRVKRSQHSTQEEWTMGIAWWIVKNKC